MGKKTGSVSPETLIAFNDEMAALIDAGIPIEVGLRGLGSPRGELAKLADSLANDLSSGQSLPDAIAAKPNRFPRVYAAVIEAGVAMGELPKALETLSDFTRAMTELRRRIMLSLMYPIVVVCVAYALFLGFLEIMVPEFHRTYRELEIPQMGTLETLDWLNATKTVWGPAIPIVFLGMLAFANRRRLFGRPSGDATTWGRGIFWLPGTGRMRRCYRTASFAELLALLIERQVVLPRALMLAAEATSDEALIKDMRRAADAVSGGSGLFQSLATVTSLPAFLKWMVRCGEQQGGIAAALRQVTEVYRGRAETSADWYRVVAPITALIVVGGGATALYGLVVFVPVTDLFRSLGLNV